MPHFVVDCSPSVLTKRHPRAIVARLAEMLPHVTWVSINVREFERATYTNRALIEK